MALDDDGLLRCWAAHMAYCKTLMGATLKASGPKICVGVARSGLLVSAQVARAGQAASANW